MVYLDDYDPANPDHVVITFDGVYQNVLQFAAPLLAEFNYPFELFLSGDHVGKDNAFDRIDQRTGLPTHEPITQFATKEELKQLVELGGRLQWHTRSHANLTKLDAAAIKRELTVPTTLAKLDPQGFTWFAYPHGEFNDQVVELVQQRFSGALSVVQGNDRDPYRLNRITMTNETRLPTPTIGVAIPSYNYGAFLPEAVESVLRQTRPADTIIISDDGSSDQTWEIAQLLQRKYPQLKLNRNRKNLGILAHFNQIVKMLDTDYVCILGADNRMRSDYLERTARILDTQPKVGVAYTDFVLFGPKSMEMYAKFVPNRKKGVIEDEFGLIAFPNFTDKTKKTLKEANFIHGSSMYRRAAFDQIGGYVSRTNQMVDDHHFFWRMIDAGWAASRVAEPLLEYRQHSNDQANTKAFTAAELHYYRSHYRDLERQLTTIHSSKFWKVWRLYHEPSGRKRMVWQLCKSFAFKVAAKVKARFKI